MILKEGLSFLKVFEENSAELQKRQKAHQDLEMIHRELQNYVNSSAEKPQLQEQCSQDRELLSKSDMYATTLKLYPASEYEAWSKRLQERIAFYHSKLDVASQTRVYEDSKYVGVWMDHRMTGKFYRYTLDGILLSYGEYRDGVRHGKMTYYYPNGTKKETVTYFDNKRSGQRRVYYENGQLARQEQYEDDVLTGYWQRYYQNGQLMWEGVVKDAKRVYENMFHSNGVIRTQSLYDTNGRLRVSYEFDRKGELVYQGLIRDGKYDGESRLFYRKIFYANVKFNKGQLISHDEVVPPRFYQMSTLNEQYKKKGTLESERIHWKPIRVYESETSHVKRRSLMYKKESHLISEIQSMTSFDKVKEECEDVPELDEEGNVRYLTKAETMRKALYDSDIRELSWRKYTMFGDLKSYHKMTISETNEKEIMKETFYPFGRNEVLLSKPTMCRKRTVEILKNGEANGHCIEYYNNGTKKAEGEKVNGSWVKVTRYLNTGKEIM